MLFYLHTITNSVYYTYLPVGDGYTTSSTYLYLLKVPHVRLARYWLP